VFELNQQDLADLDDIGPWSEIKLRVLEKYVTAYGHIMAAKSQEFLKPVYIDAFCGKGLSVSRETGDLVEGSPLRALRSGAPFVEYHFVDLNLNSAEALEKFVGNRSDVSIHVGDCNTVLLDQILPTLKFETYRRAVCFLDPYAMSYSWQVVAECGNLKTVDLVLHFPIMAINRRVLRKKRSDVTEEACALMTFFWGDSSWEKIAYSGPPMFPEYDPYKVTNEDIVEAYRRRLREAAGFKVVSKPLPLKNSTGAVIYYLLLASQKDAARKIMNGIIKA